MVMNRIFLRRHMYDELTSLMVRSFWVERNLKRMPQQKFNSFLILDFEATCERNKQIEPQEIIEFPCIKVNAETGEIEDIFHQYVLPKINPILTPFCTELTGITQDMLYNEPHFQEVFYKFRNWLDDNKVRNVDNKSIFITSGDWDLKIMFPKQCALSGIEVPPEMTHWINIKKTFASFTGHFPRGIKDMLSRLELPHRGRLHSGIDDCINIASIVKNLVQEGFIFEETTGKFGK